MVPGPGQPGASPRRPTRPSTSRSRCATSAAASRCCTAGTSTPTCVSGAGRPCAARGLPAADPRPLHRAGRGRASGRARSAIPAEPGFAAARAAIEERAAVRRRGALRRPRARPALDHVLLAHPARRRRLVSPRSRATGTSTAPTRAEPRECRSPPRQSGHLDTATEVQRNWAMRDRRSTAARDRASTQASAPIFRHVLARHALCQTSAERRAPSAVAQLAGDDREVLLPERRRGAAGGRRPRSRRTSRSAAGCARGAP